LVEPLERAHDLPSDSDRLPPNQTASCKESAFVTHQPYAID